MVDPVLEFTDLLSRLAMSLAVGLLIGLERGWYTRDVVEGARAAGLRTFALSGLLGGISGALALATSPIVLGLLFLGFTGVFTSFHWLEAKFDKDVGATSVIAGLLTFAIGAYAVIGDLYAAAACAVTVTVVLVLREPLHQWVAALRWEEIRSILILLAMTFLLLPVLPNQPIDPWDTINPREIWLLAIMIAAISFGGYIAIRIFGSRSGIIMAALAGGLASSTATTLSLARLGSGEPRAASFFSAGILIAGIVMVARVFVVVAVLNASLVLLIAPYLGAIATVLALCAAGLLVRGTRADYANIDISNPLELGTALKFAALVAVVMLATRISLNAANEAGLMLVAATSGIVDVDAATISISRISNVDLSDDWRAQVIAVAVAINTLSKGAIAAWAGGREIGLRVGGASILAVMAAGMLMFSL